MLTLRHPMGPVPLANPPYSNPYSYSYTGYRRRRPPSRDSQSAGTRGRWSQPGYRCIRVPCICQWPSHLISYETSTATAYGYGERLAPGGGCGWGQLLRTGKFKFKVRSIWLLERRGTRPRSPPRTCTRTRTDTPRFGFGHMPNAITSAKPDRAPQGGCRSGRIGCCACFVPLRETRDER